MITAYENDKVVIPEKYLKMSASELAKEEKRLYERAKSESSAMPAGKKKLSKNISIRF